MVVVMAMIVVGKHGQIRNERHDGTRGILPAIVEKKRIMKHLFAHHELRLARF